MSSSHPSRPDTLWTLTPAWAEAFAARGFEVAGALDLSFVDAWDGEGNEPPPHPWLSGDLEAWRRWIASGAHARMRFMAENEAVRTDPRLIHASVRSCVVCLVPYATGTRVRAGRAGTSVGNEAEESDSAAAREPAEPRELAEPRGPVEPAEPGDRRLATLVARYARGSDYHKVLRKRFDAVGTALAKRHEGLSWRSVVDSIPFFDRAHARAAGLGFVGKNTMLIRPGLGSYFFIATLLVDLPVEAYATPAAPGRLTSLDCGDCRKCLDACPTGALPSPYVLDASRCLSYLTIEHRGTIPEEFLPHLGGALYGCDICQEACPYNVSTLDLVRMAELGKPRASLLERSAWDLALAGEREYEAWFGGSAMTRARRGGLVRDALCYLYAVRDARLPKALAAAQTDPDPLIAATCAQLTALLRTGGEATGAPEDTGGPPKE